MTKMLLIPTALNKADSQSQMQRGCAHKAPAGLRRSLTTRQDGQNGELEVTAVLTYGREGS